jgi:hypothetical protein
MLCLLIHGRLVPIADIEVLCIAKPMVAQRSYQASRSSELDKARPVPRDGP